MATPSASSAAPPGSAGERLVVALVLALLAALVLVHAPAYVAGDEPLGADSSSHIVASTRIAEHLRAGSPGWWAPDLNLGFPLAHYYQPLPHCATALLALALGGPEQAVRAYKLWVVVLLALVPLSAYLGFRRLDLARPAALLGALALATLSTRQESFGLTARHALFVGLYTLLFGAVLVPLALAEGVRFVQGRGRALLAVPAFALLFLGHGLLALGLIPVYALVALAVPHPDGVGRARRIARLVGLGALSGLLIAGWLLPQLACSAYFNGWPLNLGAQTVDGYGLGPLLAEWLGGALLDLKRLPVLTVLSALGVGVALVGARRDPARRVVLVGLVLFLVFTAGRATFGPLLDWVFPPNSRIEGLARWVAMLQLFLALAAGLGGALLCRSLARLPWLAQRSWLPLALGAALVLALALPRHAQLLSAGLRTFPAEHDRPAFERIAAALAAEPAPGRVYVREELGHSSHWAMAYLGLLAGKPMTLSYAVGGQDSLSFYYLWFVDLTDRERAPAYVRLFDLRYLLKRPGLPLPHLPQTFVARAGPYEVTRLGGEHGLFEWTSEPRVLAARTPAEARGECLRWMREEYPRGASFLRLAGPLAVEAPSLPRSNLARDGEGEPVPFAPARAVAGEILAVTQGPSRFGARVRLDEPSAWLVLKVSAHPFWHATVDGSPVPIHYLSPSFMGLALGPGEHAVEFVFRAPGWQKALLALAPLVLVALVAGEAWRRRRAVRGPGPG
ncbi:MAG TPA: hypothetical protein VF530_01385 [Planctomycetota bacterium]